MPPRSRSLHDGRVPGIDYPIANGVKRSGKRVLAVGTDCSVGKMYTWLALDAEMRQRVSKSEMWKVELYLGLKEKKSQRE
jgi:uncharacterized NAD-dependent epimerase/dehydratase family protein